MEADDYLDPLEAEAVRVTVEADIAARKLVIMDQNEEMLREANRLTRWDPEWEKLEGDDDE